MYNAHMNAEAIKYLAAAAVIITALVSCSGTKKVSDEAVRANAEACAKLGKEPSVQITHDKIFITCKEQ